MTSATDGEFLLFLIVLAVVFGLGIVLGFNQATKVPEFHEVRCDTVYVGPHGEPGR